MLIRSLHVENLLTFETFDLDVAGQSQVIVGPNGSGKSNIFRVIDLVGKALDWAAQRGMGQGPASPAEHVLRSFAAGRHYGQPANRESLVRLEVQFTTEAAQDRLAAYLRAAVLHTIIEQLMPRTADNSAIAAQWVDDQITNDKLASLFSGTVALQHAGMSHVPWGVTYEFTHHGERYSWILKDQNAMPGIVRSETLSALVKPRGYSPLPQRLLGIANGQETGVQLPDPLPTFEFDRFCPSADEVAAPTIRMGQGIVDQRLPTFRRAIESLDLPLPETAPNYAVSLAYVLSQLFEDGVIMVGEQFRGLGIGGTPVQQSGPYPWDALVSPLRSRAPWQLPLRLFDLKNGNADQRTRFKAVQSTFAKLAPGRACDVTFHAVPQISSAPIGAGQVAVGPPTQPVNTSDAVRSSAIVSVVIERTDSHGQHPAGLPVQLHGAGVWEALVIADALVESTGGRIVILDEPAVTFHPSWQKALRSHLRDAEGQLLLVTHAADLVPVGDARDLGRLVRVENEAGHTRLHRLGQTSLSNEEIRRISREFALSADAIALLFARGVVLVEGETEQGVLPGWFADAATSLGLRSLADLDVAVYPVGGDARFRPYLTVLNAFGIPWAIVCDGAAFDLQHRPGARHVFQQLLDAGIKDTNLDGFLARVRASSPTPPMSPGLFSEQQQLGREHGILTLASGWNTGPQNNESIEAFLDAIDPELLPRAKQEVGNSKVRAGRWIAENQSCPSAVRDLYRNVLAALSRRGLNT